MFFFFQKKRLFKAIRDDDAGLVRKILIENKSVHPDAFYVPSDHGFPDKTSIAPVAYAALHKAARSLDVILGAGADVDKGCSNDGSTALILAAMVNAPQCVTKLLDAGADVNTKTSNGQTALMIAAEKNAPQCVTKLLDAGADVNITTYYGWTALMFAIEKNAPECVTKLLAAPGVDVNIATSNGRTALMFAAEKNAPELLTKLLAAPGVDVNIATLKKTGYYKADHHHNGWTALMFAAESNAPECVTKLLAAGADVEIRGTYVHRTYTSSDLEYQYTAEYIASELNHKNIVQLLKNYSFDIEKLFEAIRADDTYIVREILIDKKMVHPDVSYSPRNFNFYVFQPWPLIYAAWHGSVMSLGVILAAGADVNKASPSDGWTALMKAAELNKSQCLAKLLDAGADTQKRNDSGATAEDIAKRHSNFGIVDMLRGHTQQRYSQNSPQASNQRSSGAVECSVCRSAPAVIALIHHTTGTSHMCCCAMCAEELQRRRLPCPICRQPIDSTTKVFGI